MNAEAVAARLRGVIPPLVTPFGAGGDLDSAAFEANLEAYAAAELAGYLVLGSNGEAASLEEAEKIRLIEAAHRGAAGRLLIAGTGLESTAATVRLTRLAADCGADAALVLTPHYYKSRMTTEALRRHFEAIADASPIPVLLYFVPAFTGLPCPVELPSLLSGHPNIAGMKESSGDLRLVSQVVPTVGPRFAYVCGSAPVFYPALCAGAQAGILAVACCAPRATVALHRAFVAGDHARARTIQDALTPLAVAVTATHGVAGLKAAMDVAGFTGGSVRSPLLPTPPGAVDELKVLLQRAADA